MYTEQSNESKETHDNTPQHTIVGSSGKKTSLKKLMPLLLIIALVAMIAVISLVVINRANKTKNRKSSDTLKNLPAPKKVDISETNTPDAYSNFLAVALESYWTGGNTNGVSIPGHNYYPSAVDLKDQNWSKENMQIDEHLNQLITSGNIVYIPKGCEANKPSGANNKCTSFTININDKEVIKSKN